MKRILVPCNFSPCCENAIRFAAELSARSGAEVIVLTVIKATDTSGLTEPYMTETAAKEARIKFREIIRLVSTQTSFRHLIRKGKLLPVLLRCIARHEVDLVVMGTRGSRGWDQFFLGSSIEKVVRISPVPVFAVKGDTRINKIKNIVFPCNLKTNQPALIQKIKVLQQLFRARLHVLRINMYSRKELPDIKQRPEEYARYYGLENYSLNVQSGSNKKELILQFSKEINADMIAMPTHGKCDLKHLYANSVCADVVNHSPLLTWTCSTKKKAASTRSIA
jgi:nucleotide-binding universal stress UspA family protein